MRSTPFCATTTSKACRSGALRPRSCLRPKPSRRSRFDSVVMRVPSHGRPCERRQARSNPGVSWIAASALGLLAMTAMAVSAPAAWAQADRPGTVHRISDDLPAPYATEPVANPPRVVVRPSEARLAAPPGFAVTEYLGGLKRPRLIRTAPNGDIFVAESAADRVSAVRDGKRSTFADGLDRPFGIAFYPPGPDPRWVYIANTDSVVRIPYRSGDLQARGKAEIVVHDLPSGGHWTRSLAVTPDGRHLLVSVGSASNDAEGGMAAEADRADILEFDPDGGRKSVYASGLRNAVDIRFDGDSLLAVVNERDGLGDDLPPDYLTRGTRGGFYGWPWYYIGAHPDPAQRDAVPRRIQRRRLRRAARLVESRQAHGLQDRARAHERRRADRRVRRFRH